MMPPPPSAKPPVSVVDLVVSILAIVFTVAFGVAAAGRIVSGSD